MADKASQDNRANQLNPNHQEYQGYHADMGNPNSSSYNPSQLSDPPKSDSQKAEIDKANAGNPNYKK